MLPMGVTSENVAEKFGVDRKTQVGERQTGQGVACSRSGVYLAFSFSYRPCLSLLAPSRSSMLSDTLFRLAFVSTSSTLQNQPCALALLGGLASSAWQRIPTLSLLLLTRRRTRLPSHRTARRRLRRRPASSRRRLCPCRQRCEQKLECGRKAERDTEMWREVGCKSASGHKAVGKLEGGERAGVRRPPSSRTRLRPCRLSCGTTRWV